MTINTFSLNFQNGRNAFWGRFTFLFKFQKGLNASWGHSNFSLNFVEDRNSFWGYFSLPFIYKKNSNASWVHFLRFPLIFRSTISILKPFSLYHLVCRRTVTRCGDFIFSLNSLKDCNPFWWHFISSFNFRNDRNYFWGHSIFSLHF